MYTGRIVEGYGDGKRRREKNVEERNVLHNEYVEKYIENSREQKII
jgi:hypothetical protein